VAFFVKLIQIVCALFNAISTSTVAVALFLYDHILAQFVQNFRAFLLCKRVQGVIERARLHKSWALENNVVKKCVSKTKINRIGNRSWYYGIMVYGFIIKILI
jgi:hypothetical protein